MPLTGSGPFLSQHDSPVLTNWGARSANCSGNTGARRAGRPSPQGEYAASSQILPGYEATIWNGLNGPKNTAADVVGKLNREINAALADPKFKGQLAQRRFPARRPTMQSSSPMKPRSGARSRRRREARRSRISPIGAGTNTAIGSASGACWRSSTGFSGPVRRRRNLDYPASASQRHLAALHHLSWPRVRSGSCVTSNAGPHGGA
jgi:Tripartite tricarboxylate transporter family receptor